MTEPDRFLTVVSLGPSCETAFQIREIVEQDEAYPFDWVIAPPGAVAALVAADFAGLLQPQNLSLVPAQGETGAHVYDRAAGVEFHHDFDNTPDFMAGQANAAAKYAFLVERFRRRAGDGPILFVQQRATWGEAQALEQAIAARFPALAFRLLVVAIRGEADGWPPAHHGGRLLRVEIPGEGASWQERTPQWRQALQGVLEASFAAGTLRPRAGAAEPAPRPAAPSPLPPGPAPARSPSWITRRRQELADTFKRLADKERLVVTQPFFPFDAELPGCEVVWADDQHLRTHPDFQCDVFFTHGYPPDFQRIAYARESGRALLVANWFWDNHHLYASSMRAAMLADVNFHAHDYSSDYLGNELSAPGGFIPLCPIFWTEAVVQAAATESLLAPRSDRLYGGYNSYAEFPGRDLALHRIMQALPEHNIFITPHGTAPEQHPFYGMTPLRRLQEWMRCKVSLCMSFGANTAIRIFDCLLGGAIPLIVGRPADLDLVFPPHDRASLPVVVVESDEPGAVAHAYRLCLERFDAEGSEGVMRRWAYARSNHMPANRMAEMVRRVRALAADADALLAAP